MNLSLTYLSLLFILFIYSCGNSSGNYETTADMASPEARAVSAQGSADEIPERKLIREGNIEFETARLQPTRNNIIASVEKFGGYVSSDQEFNSPGRNSITLVVRLPSEHFDTFLAEATEGVDKLDRKQITLQDVTEEFLDIEARLKTKKELEARYLELLEQARAVTEILEIEREINRQRADIESIEGRLNYLQNQVSYSTLRITFYETISTQTAFFQKLKIGFYNGWDNLASFTLFLVNLWPFIILGIALFFGLKKYRKKKQISERQ